MGIVQKTDPKGVDAVIDQIQQYLFNNLSGAGWTNYECYPRANKNIKGNSLIPEVSKDVKNYIEVLFDDKFNATSFFLVSDEVKIDNEERLIKRDIDLIFQVRLTKLFPTVADHRADEEMHAQITQLLTDNDELINETKGYVTTVNKVYSGLRLRQFSKAGVDLDDISDFHVVRYTLTVSYDLDECSVVFAPQCDPATETMNGVGVSPIISGGTKAIIIQNDAGPPVQVGVILEDTPSSLIVSVPAATGPSQSKDVYYNRAWLKDGASFSTYDEPSRTLNGANDYNESIPDLATVQQLDFTGNLKDKLLYFNVWAHKFRYFGINGGYCNPSDGLYYDKDGVLSTKLIEFPLFNVTSYWIIDGVTGDMMPAAGFGNTTYSANLTTAASSTLEGFNDYFVFTRDELYKLADGSYNNCIHPSFRPPFNNPGTNWSCTPWQVAPSTNALAFVGSLGGETMQQAYTFGNWQEFYGRTHLTGFVTQP